MVRSSNRQCAAFVSSVITLCVCTTIASGQAQLNSAQGALSINGTGRVNPVGALIATNSQTAGTPSTVAPAYTHRTAPLTSLEFRVQGNTGRPVVLLLGPIAASPTIVGTQRIELDLLQSQLIADGYSPIPPNFLSLGANTGSSGAWTFVAASGLPAGTPALNLQAAVFDPTVASGVRLTGTVRVQTDPTLDVLFRNTVDAYSTSPTNPLYLMSLLTPGFMIAGSNGGQFLASSIQENLPSSDGVPGPADFLGLGPNTASSGSLPSGAPTAGQAVTAYMELREHLTPSCSPLPPLSSRSRLFNLRAIEQGGVWRFDGDQLPVDVEVRLQLGPAATTTAANQGVSAFLNVDIFDERNLHAGISSVTCTGPQLLTVNGTNQSTSASSGTQSLTSYGGYWNLNVELAASGTSRLPRIESGALPVDQYTITINWNDASTPLTLTNIPLRGAVDVATNPSQVLAACPGYFAPGATVTLSNAGSPFATCAASFTGGSLVNAALDGSLEVQLSQSNGYTTGQESLPLLPGATQSFTLCTPFLSNGPTQFVFIRKDVFGNDYSTLATINL